MYRVDYQVRDSGGTWRSQIATFDFITLETAPPSWPNSTP